MHMYQRSISDGRVDAPFGSCIVRGTLEKKRYEEAGRGAQWRNKERNCKYEKKLSMVKRVVGKLCTLIGVCFCCHALSCARRGLERCLHDNI